MLSLSIWKVSVLLVLVSALFISHASASPFGLDALFKRKPQATSAPTSATSATSPSATSRTSNTSNTSTTSSPSPTTTPPSPTTTPPTTTPPVSTTVPSTSKTITTSSPLMGSSTVLQTTTVVTTGANQEVITITSVSSIIESSVTGYSTFATASPGLAGQGNGDKSGGISDSSKKIIGGVVGGIGGAALLAGIAFVVWRVWGRRDRYDPNEDMDYTAGTGQGLGSSGSAAKEDGLANDNDHDNRYAGTATRPNAAANF